MATGLVLGTTCETPRGSQKQRAWRSHKEILMHFLLPVWKTWVIFFDPIVTLLLISTFCSFPSLLLQTVLLQSEELILALVWTVPFHWTPPPPPAMILCSSVVYKCWSCGADVFYSDVKDILLGLARVRVRPQSYEYTSHLKREVILEGQSCEWVWKVQTGN